MSFDDDVLEGDELANNPLDDTDEDERFDLTEEEEELLFPEGD